MRNQRSLTPHVEPHEILKSLYFPDATIILACFVSVLHIAVFQEDRNCTGHSCEGRNPHVTMPTYAGMIVERCLYKNERSHFNTG